MNNKEYKELLRLRELIRKKQASQEDKKEYMKLMYKHKHITKKQYEDFLANKHSNDLVKMATTIGGFLLFSWLVVKLLD